MDDHYQAINRLLMELPVITREAQKQLDACRMPRWFPVALEMVSIWLRCHMPYQHPLDTTRRKLAWKDPFFDEAMQTYTNALRPPEIGFDEDDYDEDEEQENGSADQA